MSKRTKKEKSALDELKINLRIDLKEEIDTHKIMYTVDIDGIALEAMANRLFVTVIDVLDKHKYRIDGTPA